MEKTQTPENMYEGILNGSQYRYNFMTEPKANKPVGSAVPPKPEAIWIDKRGKLLPTKEILPHTKPEEKNRTVTTGIQLTTTHFS
jgi:hypothetical protein